MPCLLCLLDEYWSCPPKTNTLTHQGVNMGQPKRLKMLNSQLDSIYSIKKWKLSFLETWQLLCPSWIWSMYICIYIYFLSSGQASCTLTPLIQRWSLTQQPDCNIFFYHDMSEKLPTSQRIGLKLSNLQRHSRAMWLNLNDTGHGCWSRHMWEIYHVSWCVCVSLFDQHWFKVKTCFKECLEDSSDVYILGVSLHN